ncbi:transposase [Streptomyces antimycoticus]|uniref:transposase n=1 Tax=Streptomyces antimycoticus TaxID=68175 RepID=UPI0036E5039C
MEAASSAGYSQTETFDRVRCRDRPAAACATLSLDSWESADLWVLGVGWCWGSVCSRGSEEGRRCRCVLSPLPRSLRRPLGWPGRRLPRAVWRCGSATSWVCCSRTRTSWGRFPARGGPGLAPGTLAVVSVMQFAERLTDRQPADAVRSRIDWIYLLGLELEDEGFPFSVLSGFRTRLVEHSHEQGVLDRLLSRLSGLDFPRAGGRVRTDATHVLALVRDVNRLEFRTETPRCALEALAVAAGDWLHAAQIADASWQKRYGQRADSYRPPKGDVQRGAFAVQDGADGFTLLDAVHRPDAPAWLRQLPADARSAAGVGPAVPPGRRTRPGDAPAGGQTSHRADSGRPARTIRTHAARSNAA